MSAKHPPGPGVEISLRIGQRVRHRDHQGQRVTGVVRGLSIDSDRVLQVDIVLDAPIVIPARHTGDREVNIWHQHVPAHELTPFDDRDQLTEELLEAANAALDALTDARADDQFKSEAASLLRAAIAKATGGDA